MSRPSAKGARAKPPGNGPVGGWRAVAPESPATGSHRGAGAMPEGHDAIRIRFDDDEPPALVFNAQAQPGALVSWAWCELTALDALLRAVLERRSAGDGDADVVGAVRTVLVPVIAALAFSEQRAHQLEERRRSAPIARVQGKRGGRRKKHAAE